MSRLDDELRKAFKREQPSADFTERLMERVSHQPAPKTRWWQRLATLIEPPKLRWVAIGATASLLLAIAATQFNRIQQTPVNDNGSSVQANLKPKEEKVPDKQVAPKDENVVDKQPAFKNEPSASPMTLKHPAQPVNRRHLLQARHDERRELKSEGEAAKEKLMLALSIASSALSDAQKAVHDDGLNP
jgi:hypothetical protein